MKKLFLVLFILSFTVITGCSKKEEEIKVKKQQEDTTSKISRTEPQTFAKTEVIDDEGTEGAGEQSRKTYSGKTETISITAAELKSSVGKRVKMTAYVADVAVREKVAYLNIDKKFPNNTGSITIFSSDFDKFGDLEVYKNKNIEVSGTVSEYKNKPQIILKSPNQIKITN